MNTVSNQQHLSFFQRASRWVPIVALISLSILLWLPFGLQVGYFADEWTTLAGVQAGAFLTSTVRPFELVPWFIAYHLAPNSYMGLNLLILLLIIGKGVMSYLLLCDLGFNQLYAFGSSVLLILYPADTGVFYLGTVSIHASIFTYLLALWLLVRFWKSGRRWLWILIALISGLCTGFYEGIYPLIFLAPLVLVYLQRGITRRVFLTSLLWLAVPILFGLRLTSILFLNSSSANTYQSSLFASDHSIGTILASLWRANRYSLLDSWISAAMQTFAYNGWSGFRNVIKTTLLNPYLVYALMAAGIVIVVSLILMRFPQNGSASKKHSVLLLVVSPIILTFGFLLYSVTNLRDINLRTFLHASMGAALFISTALWLLGGILRRQSLIYSIGLTILALVATSSLLIQHHGYDSLGKSQIPFMQSLVQAAPHITPKVAVVVMDETPNHDLDSRFNHISSYLQAAIQMIYGDNTLSAAICYPDAVGTWGVFEEKCVFNTDTMQLVYKGVPAWTREYNQIVIFRYATDKTLHLETDITPYLPSDEASRLYAPDKLIAADSPRPIRAQTMLNMAP